MIDGLKLTMTGEELRRMLQKRADSHRASASRWSHELTRTPDGQTEEDPLLPEHMCENEAERHEWRAEVLEFIRERLEPLESTGSVSQTSRSASCCRKRLGGSSRMSMKNERAWGSNWGGSSNASVSVRRLFRSRTLTHEPLSRRSPELPQQFIGSLQHLAIRCEEQPFCRHAS